MSQRFEFVVLAQQPQSNVRLLCRRLGISSKTGYKWIARHRAGGGGDPLMALADRSRRPAGSPRMTPAALTQAVCAVRREHPCWGGRKIRAILLDQGHRNVPATSTITDILRRNGLIDPQQSAAHAPWTRFEQEHPNDLWQMDFVGPLATAAGQCHPLTVLDDHSRFCLAAVACGDQTGKTVQNHLIDAFRRYGLPRRILSDNGSPWGGCGGEHRYTWLGAWLIRLGVGISHGRPYHPQTQGKDERFNRTLKAEAIGNRRFDDVDQVQRQLTPWRDLYNLQRPHESLGMKPPASRYRPSAHAYPERLEPIQYSPGDAVRMVHRDGYFNFKGQQYKTSQAFAAQPIALRQGSVDGQMNVYYCHQQIAVINLRKQDSD